MPRQSQSATIQTRHPQDHKCCGIVEGARYQVEIRRENRTTPQPWIARKLLVFVTIGILAYAAYVYIGRFCIKFIEGTFNRRASGIALLIVFVILYFWTIWSYMKVILTSPGYAKNHVHSTSTPQPTFSRQGSQPLPLHRVQKESDDIQLREPSGDSRFSHKREHSLSTLAGTQPSPLDTVGGPSYEDILLRTTTDKTVPRSNEPQAPDPDVAVALPPPAVTPSPAQRKLRKIFHPPRSKVSQPRVYITRRPPMKAVLLPEHRYCDKEAIVKPYRAHHCRHCGACVLKYDHHCPWIGQCVGARNHKFFVNFTQAAGILCVYVFSTILAFDLHDTVTHHTDFDPQHIVLIALAGLFSIFTWTLTVSHVMLITGSKTTIEHMIIRRMEEHESEQLDKAFAFWDFRGRKLMRKEWDREWGKLNTEGHIWWTDDKRRAWEDVMGQSVLGWFLPIGRGLNDGLSFPVNPRFDADGRWRRRTEWPPEYQ